MQIVIHKDLFRMQLKNILLKEINHEIISLNIIKLLNEEMKGKLSLAIEIFTNKYKRKMYQLVSRCGSIGSS